MRNGRRSLCVHHFFKNGVVLSLSLLICTTGMTLSFPYVSVAEMSGQEDIIPLQPIIDRSSPGEVVILEQGIYSGPVNIDKKISIRGDSSVTLLSKESSSTVTIRSDGVTLQGFNIQHHSGAQTAAIQVTGHHAVITNLHIQSQGYGIVIRNANDGVIQNNKISWAGPEAVSSAQKGNGIDLYSSYPYCRE
jgi:nitrous oxidase accessory protein